MPDNEARTFSYDDVIHPGAVLYLDGWRYVTATDTTSFHLTTVPCSVPDDAATYEWHCERCGHTTYCTGAGTNNLGGDCDPHCSDTDLRVYAIHAGERRALGSPAELMNHSA